MRIAAIGALLAIAILTARILSILPTSTLQSSCSPTSPLPSHLLCLIRTALKSALPSRSIHGSPITNPNTQYPSNLLNLSSNLHLTTLSSWVLISLIESYRLGAPPLLHWHTPLALLAFTFGHGIVLPLLWFPAMLAVSSIPRHFRYKSSSFRRIVGMSFQRIGSLRTSSVRAATCVALGMCGAGIIASAVGFLTKVDLDDVVNVGVECITVLMAVPALITSLLDVLVFSHIQERNGVESETVRFSRPRGSEQVIVSFTFFSGFLALTHWTMLSILMFAPMNDFMVIDVIGVEARRVLLIETLAIVSSFIVLMMNAAHDYVEGGLNVLFIAMGSVVVGPGAAMLWMWKERERRLVDEYYVHHHLLERPH
ncbi:hypothetical protein BC829DRAFT_487120 [Chytridium lagenaria]|nr:hypothetical protein BC829DRAFT_487120 [Chytridium lagenaria]